jgi:hypothetical protein
MQEFATGKFHGVRPWRHQSYPNPAVSERTHDFKLADAAD